MKEFLLNVRLKLIKWLAGDCVVILNTRLDIGDRPGAYIQINNTKRAILVDNSFYPGDKKITISPSKINGAYSENLFKAVNDGNSLSTETVVH